MAKSASDLELLEHGLFHFDFNSLRFSPLTIPNIANGRPKIVLSPNGRVLANYGSFHAGCGFYTTYVNFTDLQDGSGRQFSFEQEAFYELALSPDGQEVLIARGEGCGSHGADEWSIACGLSDGFEIYHLQLWDWQSDRRVDLAPGLEPAWSDDGRSIAFRSCLAQMPSADWVPVPNGPPWLYLLQITQDGPVISPIAVGEAPAWRP